VRKVFYALPDAQLVNLMHRIHEEARRRRFVYERDGQFETVRVLLRPHAVMPDQMAYLHYVSLTLLNALKRLPEMYLADPEIRRIVPLSEEEESWLHDSWGASQRDTNPVFGRLDGVIEFTSPMWKDSLQFIEPNLCGVGGIHLGPTCDGLIDDFVVPVLREFDPSINLERGPDLRELFIQEVLEHMEAIGRRGQHVCFVEPKYADQGIDEQTALAEYYLQRHGLNILHADPSELYIKDGEVCYEGTPIDVAYRDYEVRDLIALHHEEGVNVEPMKRLFRENRMISTMAGEFDHKSSWEILTDPTLARKYFNADERQVFRRHVCWTRLLYDRRTALPDGQSGDLLKFVRKHRDILVLKPNRSYGGDRVLIGPSVEPHEWEQAIEQGLADHDLVVQRLASIPVGEYPLISDDGAVHVEPFYTVMGFAPTKYGLAILGRASQKQVVNVAQRGGMCSVFQGRPPGRLVGPAPAPVAYNI
jgi:hypothetical protein